MRSRGARLRTALDDLADLLLWEVPVGLRVGIVVMALLTAYNIGMISSHVVRIQAEEAQAAVRMDVADLRNQVRHLWGEAQMTRNAQARHELKVGEALARHRVCWRSQQ